MSNIKDWCISRQLWWGHRIPVWYIVGKDPEEEYIVARNEEEALNNARQKFGKHVEIYQDPDVLDTWFSRYVVFKHDESDPFWGLIFLLLQTMDVILF